MATLQDRMKKLQAKLDKQEKEKVLRKQIEDGKKGLAALRNKK